MLFEPVRFFQKELQQPFSWPRTMGGPVLCMLLYVPAFGIISGKTLETLVHSVERSGGSFPASQSWPWFLAMAGGMGYLIYWLMATGFIVCFDVLARGLAGSWKLLQLTGTAHYSQVPYLAFVMALALSFSPPPLVVEQLHPEEMTQLFRDYRNEVNTTVTIALARNFGYVFQAWLVFLFVCAYRAYSRLSMWGCVLLFVSLLAGFHLWSLLL
jgi:hypothetical protein